MTTTLDQTVPGRLLITHDQLRRFDEDGYFLVEDALTGAEIERLVAAVDLLADRARRRRGLPPHAPVRVRNIVARHDAFRGLLDHPATLPFVVDVMGPRIQLRGSNLDVRPPIPAAERAYGPNPADFALHWHRDEPHGGWPTVDGVVPFLEIKVGYYLTDLTGPHRGALRVVRGSHRRPDPADVDPRDVHAIEVAPGTALVWRTALLHNVAPNHSDTARKCLYLAYQHRWLRPSDYVVASAELLAGCNPIQRQLLGGVAEEARLVKDADVEPCSTYWTPSRADLPLQEWAEQRGFAAARPVDHGVRTGSG